MPRDLPCRNKFDTASCDRLWSSRIQCSALVQGLRNKSGEHFGGSLVDYGTPQLPLRECPVDVGCVVGGFTAELVGVKEDGCSLSLT